MVEGLVKLQEVSRVRSMQVKSENEIIREKFDATYHYVQDSEANWRLKRVVRVIDCGQL